MRKPILYRIVFLALFVVCLALSGCGGSSSGNPADPGNPVESDFTLSAQPSQISITAGSSATFSLNLVWSGSPVGPVSINATFPSGISADITLPTTIAVGSTSVILKAASSASAGSSAITLTATATGNSSLAHTYTIPINIVALPPPPVRTLSRTGYILTGGEPQDILYDPAHKLLWVSVPDLGQVLVIDPAQRKVINRLPVPLAGDMDLSLDGTQIVVGSNTLPRLTFIDVASQSVVRTSLFTTDKVDAAFPYFPPYVDASDEPYDDPVISQPRFIAGGDVVFLGFGGLFRWSAATNTMNRTKGGNFYAGTTLSRTPDGTKVLITTTENELDVYDPSTDSLSAQNQTYSRFAAADPVTPRFALFDTNGYDIVDTNLNQIGSVATGITNGAGATPYAFQFSADGTQLFVARSGLFNTSYALQTVDVVNYKLGSQAPLTNFDGSLYLDGEVPQAIDSSNVIYGLGVGGVVLDDPLNYFTAGSLPYDHYVGNSLKPNDGPVASSTSTTLPNLYSSTLQSVYFDGVPASISGASGSIGASITVTAPPIQASGPATVHAFASDGSFSAYPAAYTYGVQAVALEPNAGPASGGITADLLAYGVGGGGSAINVTVGGVPAKVNSVQIVGGEFPYLLPLYDVQIVLPAGTAGASADVTVTASGNTATMPHAFTYEPALTNYPFPTSTIPSSIYFDRFRQQAYLLSPSRIDVFSLKSSSFLAPIIPPTKNGTLFITDLDLSVDGKTMIVADMQDQTLALLDPDNPGDATLVTFAPPFFAGPLGPRYVAANSKGTYFVSPGDTAWTGGGGTIWEFNPASSTFTQRVGPLDTNLEFSGTRLFRSKDGTTVLIQSPNEIPSSAVVWNASTDTFLHRNLPGFDYDAAVSPDGSLLSAFVDPDTEDGILYQYVFDSSLNVLMSMSDPDWLHTGWLWGSFFDPSGTLFYVPDNEGLDIYDIHSGHLRRRIGVREAPNPTVYTASTSDDTGNTLLLLTNDGLDVISDVPPLAIRSVSPLPSSASAGSIITVKGTGFIAGSTVTIASQTVPAIVSDSHTLTFSLPSVVAGNTLVVTSPDGSTSTF